MKKQHGIVQGDEVRFIITSYYELMKSEYNQPHYFNDPNSDRSSIMLGGCYLVTRIGKNRWGTRVFDLAIGDTTVSRDVPSSYFKKYSPTESCNYKKGDYLKYQPKSSRENTDFLTNIFPKIDFINELTRFTITKTINSYYLLVEKTGGGNIDFPLLWTDFIIASSSADELQHTGE
jgi:hypothetical protein